MRRVIFGSGLAAVGLYFSVACTSTITGNEGNLDFSYTADDQVTNFNKPIAVGAKLELKVLETGTRAEVDVQEASTDDPSVLEVETFSSNRVILVGRGEGEALVEVSARVPNGEVLSDSVNMLAAVPEVLKLRHSCTVEGVSAKYLANTKEVHVGYDMEKANGQAVIGYGYFPIEVAPEGLVTLDETSTNQANFLFDIGADPGVVTISSTIDDAMLELDIVTEAAIDGIAGPVDPVEVRVDSTSYVNVHPTVGDDPVCASNAAMTAESKTPDICTVTAVAPLDAEEEGILGRTGAVAVEGKAFGNCTFSVTYTNAADGAGVTQDFEASVGDFPESGEQGE